jgi:hypothetical protein
MGTSDQEDVGCVDDTPLATRQAEDQRTAGVETLEQSVDRGAIG